MAILCSICTSQGNTVEFNTLKELSAHNKGGHQTKGAESKPAVSKKEQQPVKPVKEEPKEPKEPEEPIYNLPILEYKYLGLCKLGHQIETIRVEAGEYDLQIAYCSECKEKITQEYVMSLEAQRLAIQKLVAQDTTITNKK